MRTTRVQAEELVKRIRERFPDPDLVVEIREYANAVSVTEHWIEVSRDGNGVLFSLESLDGGPGAIREQAMVVIAAMARTPEPPKEEKTEKKPRRKKVDESQSQEPDESHDVPEEHPDL
jgi:hypothetical protein